MRLFLPNLPALEPIGLDYRVLGFSLALAVVTGLAFGLAPALQASRVSLNEVLKEAGRSGTEFRSGMLFRNLLIICETALAMVLLVGAGLLFQSFLRVRGIDLGFKSEHTLSLTIDLTLSKYPTPERPGKVLPTSDRRDQEPGRSAIGRRQRQPPAGRSTEFRVRFGGRRAIGKNTLTFFAKVSPDYFRTMGIPLVRGRYFGEGDREGSPSVAIVNESFARRYFPGEICLGRRVESWVHKNDWLTIVGVVGDVRGWVEREPNPEIYLPYLQAGRTLYDPSRTHGGKPTALGGGRAQAGCKCRQGPATP